MAYQIGKYTYGQEHIQLYWRNNKTKLEIGKFCSIASNCKIYLGGNHHTEWVTTYPFGCINKDVFNIVKEDPNDPYPTTKGSVIIGNDVWIADNVTIMSGVTIGDGAVIANNSHVVKNVEPYSLTGGNPAKHIKYRFTPEQIEQLLEIKWWNWDDAKINRFSPLLCNPDIDDFITKVNLER